MMTKLLEPIIPGEILLEEFMKPLEVSQNQLARDIRVPVGRINDIIHGRRGISPDTAIRLGAYFKTTPEFWLNLQSRYDLKTTQRRLQVSLHRIVRPLRRKPA